MRNHIALKFLAVLLATVTLFGVVCSAGGIIVFTGADLYEKTPQQLAEEERRGVGELFANELAENYANTNLGSLPEQLSYENRHYYFDYGRYGYTLKNAEGKILETKEVSDMGKAETYRYTLTDGVYMHVEKILSEEEFLLGEPGWEIVNEIPAGGAKVATVNLETTDGGIYSISGDAMGYLSGYTDGTVVFVSYNPYDFELLEHTTIRRIEFFGTEGNLLYGSPLGVGIGEITISQNGMWKFTAPAQKPEATVAIPEMQEDVRTTTFFDWETNKQMKVYYTYKQMPDYTVELYLLPGALGQDSFYALLQTVWGYRNQLIYLLGVSLLLFAVVAVYLCCAAGRKPGSEEIKAGGLNALPLDLYVCIDGCLITFLLFAAIEGSDYLLRYNPQLLLPLAGLEGFGFCLLIVAFCFACAAQFKTPGGYWWRNLLITRCFLLAGQMLMGMVRFVDRQLAPRFERLCKKVWQLIVRLMKTAFRVLAWIFRKIYHFFDVTLERFFHWLGRKVITFFSLLPLTWQWMLVGIIMVFFLFAFPAAPIYRVLLAVCVILYGAHCFGILLQSTKRMSKGDLETKVSDQFLVGSFREFAGELNALADVAMVAAQKQLKSERMKTELITNVSHDIKTPLTSIINYVDLLRKPHTEEEQVEYLEVLARQSDQLKKLISDLMEMSKASTGNMPVEITAVNAQETLAQALGEFSDKLDAANLSPVIRQPEETLYMKADGRLVWRVLSNLLGNAVKYALPGTRVYVDLMELEGKVLISLKNISREPLNISADELLERFVRGDTSRNTEGSGLGLNIAQSLMELQKGQLQLLVDGDLFKVTLVFPAVKE